MSTEHLPRAVNGYERSTEPIAILGIGPRFPAGSTHLMTSGSCYPGERDAISQFPTDRGWNLDVLFGSDPDSPGTTYVAYVAGAVSGVEVFVEAELPKPMEAEARGFGLHPVVLDAILHGIGAGSILAESELTRLPFEWEGVSVYAAGATRVRAGITLVADDTVAITLTDGRAALVARIDSLTLRGISLSRLLVITVADDVLYGLDWVALAPSDGSACGSSDGITALLGNRRGRNGRRTRLPERGIRRCIAATPALRGSIHRAGQSRHPNPTPSPSLRHDTGGETRCP